MNKTIQIDKYLVCGHIIQKGKTKSNTCFTTKCAVKEKSPRPFRLGSLLSRKMYCSKKIVNIISIINLSW